MSFKDFIAQDLDTVFFDTDTFSESAIIDDHVCEVQIDNERLLERSEKEYGGITAGLTLYFIPVSKYPGVPRVGNSQVFNKKLVYIDSVSEMDGVYEIVINQNRGE